MHPIPRSRCISRQLQLFLSLPVLVAGVCIFVLLYLASLSPPSNMDFRESIVHQTSFSLQLAKPVSSSLASDSNLAFSPISIHTALALVAAGSKGETQKQILSVLRSGSATDLSAFSSQIGDIVLDGSPSGGPRLIFANGVWVDASLSLKSTFKKVVTSAYKAEIRALDFQSKADEARRGKLMDSKHNCWPY